MNSVTIYEYPDYPDYFRIEVTIDGIVLLTGFDKFMMNRKTVEEISKKLATALNCKIGITNDRWFTI